MNLLFSIAVNIYSFVFINFNWVTFFFFFEKEKNIHNIFYLI